MTDDDEVERFDCRQRRWQRALRDAPDIGGIRLSVLLALATYMDPDGSGAYPSQATLAKNVVVSEKTIHNHLSAARRGGWLRQVERGHRRGDGSSTGTSWQASLPAARFRMSAPSTGTLVQDEASQPEAQPEAQPEDGDTAAPITDQGDQCERGDLRSIAEKLISAKKDRDALIGETVGILHDLRSEYGDPLDDALEIRLQAGAKYRWPTIFLQGITSELEAVKRHDQARAEREVVELRQVPDADVGDASSWISAIRNGKAS